MRPLKSLVIAILLIAAGAAFVWHTNWSIDQRVRQTLRELQASGKVDPALRDVDPNTVRLSDLQVQLTRSEQTRLDIAAWLEEFGFLLVPLTLALCVGVAFAVGKPRRSPSEPTGPE